MGFVFLFIFSAYITIQAFAKDMYGDDLGSKTEASLYLSFTFFCFLSPAITNKIGPKMTMFFGCLCYGCLVAASLFYFESGKAAMSEANRKSCRDNACYVHCPR